MQIIPVIDVLAGQAVRAVAGRRSEYRPVVSQLLAGSSPRDLATAYAEGLGLTTLYLADLDAILHGRPNWQLYEELRQDGRRVWIDAGVRNVESAARVRQAGAAAVVVGLESWPEPEQLADLLKVVPAEEVVFSLDLQQGRALGTGAWPDDPAEIARIAVAAGVEQMIVLDLAQVGTGEGISTDSLCRLLRARYPHMRLITGGGVRDVRDLQRLQGEGLQAVLVGSALHDGRLSPADLAQFATE